jgi:hypothetical protein
MPNTPVPAAGGAMPAATLNRRNFLREAIVAGSAALAAGTAVGAAAALAAPAIEPEPRLASAARAGTWEQEFIRKLRLLRRRDPELADAFVRWCSATLDESRERVSALQKPVLS